MAKDLESVLTEQLPEASPAHCRKFASLLSGREDADAAKNTLQALIEDGCDSASLHAALLYGRHYLIRTNEEGEKAVKADDTMLYYDRLTAILMQLATKQLRVSLHQAEANLLHKGQTLLLTRAKNRWLKDGVIELYNYFMEVPIIARVALLESREDGITVERTEDAVWAITAGEHGRFIQTRIPDSSLCLRMEVQSTAGQKIHLRDAGMLQIAKEKRSHIRVQSDSVIPVRITTPQGDAIDAAVQDYSEAGLGVSTQQRVQLKESDAIHIFMNMHGMEIDVDARVCWLKHASDQVRFGLDLDLHGAAHIRQHLQRQIVIARRSIMSRLRMQGISDCLLTL